MSGTLSTDVISWHHCFFPFWVKRHLVWLQVTLLTQCSQSRGKMWWSWSFLSCTWHFSVNKICLFSLPGVICWEWDQFMITMVVMTMMTVSGGEWMISYKVLSYMWSYATLTPIIIKWSLLEPAYLWKCKDCNSTSQIRGRQLLILHVYKNCPSWDSSEH